MLLMIHESNIGLNICLGDLFFFRCVNVVLGSPWGDKNGFNALVVYYSKEVINGTIIEW